MEGVPRLPMLGFELKSFSEHVDFTTPLKSYIAEFYSENAELYNKECFELDQLRKIAVSSSIDFMGCSNMKKYYCQIEFLLSRFPVTDGGSIQMQFTWEDTMSQQMITFSDIKFEQANILYNIGCLHSKLGSMDNRMTPEGMKISCTHFQCSAWMFQHLRDTFESFKCLDFNRDFLSFMSTTMLAQAQECILEKSMTDNRKSSITAKVSAQIVEYYKTAMKHLNTFLSSTSASSKNIKDWKRRLDLKMGFYECITLYYMALNAEEQSKWGERLAYIQAAMNQLEDLTKTNKSEGAPVVESLKFMVDVIGGKFNSAKKDNDFIYHDKVPSLDALPEIKGASLVKGIPLNLNDAEVAGQDIFKKLVPFVVHQKSSLYSEEKAKLLRKVGTDIELKNLELKNFLSLLQLNPGDSILPESTKIPDKLLEKCASMSVRQNAIKDLVSAMQALSSRSTDVEGDLCSTLKLIEMVENGIQVMSKASGIQADGLKECDEIRKECTKYGDTLKSTSQLNEELHGIMEKHISNLKILSSPVQDLYTAISSLQYMPTESELEILQDMKKLIDKVDHMAKQRIQLGDKLRDQIQKDDVTHILVVASTDINYEELFKEQLEKHSQQVGLINQNLTAQVNILHALTEANAKYAGVRKSMAESNQRQQDFIDDMIKSYEVYEDLLSKTQQGVDLYDKLSTHVSKLLEKAENLLKNHQAKEATLREKAVPQMPVILDTKASSNLNSATKVPQLSKPLDAFGGPPKLKDYLPFMKPNTFGPQSPHSNVYHESNSQVVDFPNIPSLHSASLPNSHAASPLRVNIPPPQPKIQSGASSLTNLTVPSSSQPLNSFHQNVAQPTNPPHEQIRLPSSAPLTSFVGNQPMSSGIIQNLKMGTIPSFPGFEDPRKKQNFSQTNQQQIDHFVIPTNTGIKTGQPNALTDQITQHGGPLFIQTTFHQQLQSAIQNPLQPATLQQHMQPTTTLQQMRSQTSDPRFPHQSLQFFTPQASLGNSQSMSQTSMATPLPLHVQNAQQHQQRSQQLPQNFQQSQVVFPQPQPNLQSQESFHQLQRNFQQTHQRFHQLQQNLQQLPHSFQQPKQDTLQSQTNFPNTPLSFQSPFQQAYNLQQAEATNNQFSSINPHFQQDRQQFGSPYFPPFATPMHPIHPAPTQPTPPLSSAALPSMPLEPGKNNFSTSQDSRYSQVPIDRLKKTSLDEMLSSGNNLGQQSSVLIPKVITDEDLKREQNEEAKKNLKLNAKDPYADPEILSKFEAEVEAFATHVEELCRPSANKMRVLENEWKELNEGQDKSTKSFSMAIARCYPLKNRQHDVMPFDSSRVRLIGAADDYINASLIKSTSLACPDIIATQAPLPVTFSDFWQMIYDYNIEVIVMLCSENEASTKGQVYWPTDKGQKAIVSGNFAVTLHSVQVRPMWTERVITIMNSKSQVSRSVIHLNFHSWLSGAEPDNCDSLLQFIAHVHGLYLQQRSLMRPIVVHCSNGVGRTGTFTVIYAGVLEVNQGSGIIDICKTISQMRVQRKSFVEFERQLKFCYTCILQHAQNVLRSYGKQTGVTQTNVAIPQGHNCKSNTIKNMEFTSAEVVTVDSKDTSVPTNLQVAFVHQDIESQDVEVQQPASPTQKQQQPALQSGEHQAVNATSSCITDIQNPEKFSMDCKATRNKITKANFFNQTGLLGNKPSMSIDPLNELDPLWTMKK